MLKPKLKECLSCGNDRIIWKDGKCQQCCSPSYKPLSAGTGFKKTKNSLKKTRNKKPGNKQFFESQAAVYQENPISFESGKNLGVIGNVNLAHILPKEIYKSLAHESLNIILLSWEEHTRFDELLNRHNFDKLEEEFKSWSKICERLKILLPLCLEGGKLKLALKTYLS